MVQLQLKDELERSYREKYLALEDETERFRNEYNKLKYEFSFLKSEYEHEKAEHVRVVEESRLRHEAEVREFSFFFMTKNVLGSTFQLSVIPSRV